MAWFQGPWVLEFANMRPKRLRERRAAEIGPPAPKRKLGLTKIVLDENNRMLRAGFGKHDGTWFIRVDLWWAGWRLARGTA
jgi:hypothetical protein